jgi:hypothetical protein
MRNSMGKLTEAIQSSKGLIHNHQAPVGYAGNTLGYPFYVKNL